MIFVLSSLRYVAAYENLLSSSVLTLHLSFLSRLHFVCAVTCKLIRVVVFGLVSFLSHGSPVRGTQSSIYIAVQILSEV